RATPERLAALASADPRERARALLGIHGILDPARFEATEPDAGLLAGLLVDRPVIERLESEALELVSGNASASEVVERSRADARAALVRSLRRSVTVRAPDAGLVVDAVLDDLVRAGRLARSGDRLHGPGHEFGPGVAVRAAMDRLEGLLATVAPPSLADAVRASGCPPDGVRMLEASGRIVRLDDDLAYAASTYGELARTALRMATAAALTPAALRDQTGTSRKYVMAILEDLDRRGILRREPDGHRPGPRSSLAAEFGRAVP
ncbi:MAG: SelB C-terminal domain-containing protein, partial [Candidatus Limnocylindrales bacterium]